MSDDLIKRSDAIEAIEEVDWWHQNRYGTMVSGANSDEHQAWYKVEDVYKTLENVPSIDRPPSEVKPKQGKWIYIDEPMIGNPYGRYKCSECNLEEPFTSNYCPNCGAKMIGG